MPYILVARDGDGPSARLVSGDLFPTREAALDALQDLVTFSPGLREARLFVVDLDLASPVLLVEATEMTPVPEGPVAQPRLDEEAGDTLPDEPPLESSAELAALAGEAPAGDTLGESEEPVAYGPVPVEPDAEGSQPAVETGSADLGAIAEDEVLVASAGPADTAPLSPGAIGAEEVEGPAASSVWPEETAARDAAVLQAISSLGRDERSEPVLEASIASEVPASWVDQATGPDAWPWAEEEPTGSSAASVVPVSPSVSDRAPSVPEAALAAAEPVTEGAEDVEPSPAEASDETALPAPAPEARAVEGATPAEAAAEYPPPGYEFAGDLDLAGYACEDCIYVNTCPRAGESAPAECGSFQWRSS